MKKFFISLVLLVTVCINTTNAEDIENISPAIKATIQKEFAGARLLDWKEIGRSNVYRLRFIYENTVVSAFFNKEGTLLATGRFITKAALPLAIRKVVTDKYSRFSINEIAEYAEMDQTTYVVEMENERIKQAVRIYINGDCSIVKKEKKVLK